MRYLSLPGIDTLLIVKDKSGIYATQDETLLGNKRAIGRVAQIFRMPDTRTIVQLTSAYGCRGLGRLDAGVGDADSFGPF